MPINDKIIQIMSVSKPLVAVFKDSKDDIFTEEIYAFALIETEDGQRFLRGVEAAWDEIGYSEWDNFLGYAKDKAEAHERYGKEEQSDNPNDRIKRAKEAVMEYQKIVNSGIKTGNKDKLIDTLCRQYYITEEVFENEIRAIEERILEAKPWTKADCFACQLHMWKRLPDGSLGEWCDYFSGERVPLDQIDTCPNGGIMTKKLTTPFPMD